ncbi:MAG: roadblock/LC7 domain-containing protein [Gemmatimonadales bacterium]|nr:roadblock/LC7 domain-containing protein [Gemmatimonadota bacterium]MCC7134293.1 roadblock/LC7 domain-containing protein [Gemmatimonadales bacterium]MDX2060172.1 roadblock/LC7 domain-containing protein [Gemmatimonadales bacterium]
MTAREQMVLDDITRVSGVKSAILVAADDGLVVAESALEGQATEAAAAFAARLAQRLAALTRTLHTPPMSVMLLQATGGQLFVAAGGEGLLLVAVTGNDVNIGEVRLALLDAAGRLN